MRQRFGLAIRDSPAAYR